MAAPGDSASEVLHGSALLHRLPTRAPGGLVYVVVDTPMGSRNKYKFDETLNCFRLSRILPLGASFPGDFGSIPRTRAEDGDSLDVLLLADTPSFVGCVMTARLIGVIRARQTEGRKTLRNDRLIGVPVTAVNPPAVKHVGRLPPNRLAELEHFFVSYNAAQGRVFRPSAIAGPADAARALRDAAQRYQVHRRRSLQP